MRRIGTGRNGRIAAIRRNPAERVASQECLRIYFTFMPGLPMLGHPIQI